ncbi:MAG: tyrosine-type recombinase/integrase [Bacillota bacterium]
MKRKNYLNEPLNKEINEYKKFVTNPYNLHLKKIHLQRETTFESLTKHSLKKFVEFLVEVKRCEPTSISENISYFKEYCDWLLSQYKTETFQIKTRWVSSFLSFCIVTKRITKKDKKLVMSIRKYYKKIKNRITYQDGRNTEKMNERAKTDIYVIIEGIKKVEKSYELSMDRILLKAKIALKILLHLCWRTRNIRTLKLGETLYYENGLWHYRFTPEQQKAPQRQGKKLKVIKGVFPSLLQDDLTEYINNHNITDYLFKTNQGKIYNTNSFSKYISVITKRYIGIDINPHSFRKIVFTYLIKNNFDNVKAELMLWHKPKTLSEVDFHYFNTDINDAVIEANKVLMKLYQKPKKQKKDEKIIRVDFNKKKAQE